MELDLSRNDLMSTTTAAPRTLAVFPPGANKTQKFVVGDSSGIMQCISVKPSGITVAFKTLPHPDQRVTGLSTGKGKTQRDKCFSAHGNKIKGTNKKGKEFFKFATNHTEAINSVFVNDTTIHAATDYSVSEFQDGQDKHLYMAPDRINCTDVVPLLSFASFNPVLACQDRTLRILTGDRCLFEAPVPGAATCVKFVADAHDPLHLHPGCRELLYGTENGHMGQLMADTDTVRKGFQLAFDRRPAAVTALFSGIDLTKDGVNDILVGRDDGTVELYDLDLDSGELVLVCSHKFGESINTLDGGFITNGNVEDYLVQTFSGKVIALCQPGGGVVHTGTSYTSRKMEEAQERKATYDMRTAALQADILQLKEQVENERSKWIYSLLEDAMAAGAAPGRYQQITAELVAVENANEMKHSLCLVPEEACYRLSIEAATPIIAVALHADLALELIDVENSTAILSITPPPPDAPNQTLATYRCQETSSRLEIRFRVQEGLWGSVRVFPVPKNAPKTCEAIVYRVKPLSYHCAASNLDTDRPLTTLTISGAFSMVDIHSWVEACLPDVAKQPPGEVVEKQFQNVAFGSILLLRYRAGEAQFQSDALHVLSILREAVMELATAANQQISVAFGLDTACIPHFVRLLWPKLEYQRSLARRVGMIDALQELRMQDGDTSYLSSELQSTLSNTEKVQKEFEEQPKQLSYLHRVVRDSYALYCSLQGHSAPGQRMPHLQHLLDSSSTLQDVVDFVMA